MNLRKRIYIEQFTDLIRELYDIPMPIKNIEEVVSSLGGALQKSDNAFLLDGKISKCSEFSEIKFLIEINQNLSMNRKNFTIAHEIGHLFLHMGYEINPQKWDSIKPTTTYQRSGHSEEEVEANEFAASLLMPEEAIRNYVEIREDSAIDIKELAKYFNVSVSSAVVRCRVLGLI